MGIKIDQRDIYNEWICQDRIGENNRQMGKTPLNFNWKKTQTLKKKKKIKNLGNSNKTDEKNPQSGKDHHKTIM